MIRIPIWLFIGLAMSAWSLGFWMGRVESESIAAKVEFRSLPKKTIEKMKPVHEDGDLYFCSDCMTPQVYGSGDHCE